MAPHLKPSDNVNILFVAASPENEANLWLDEEIREITQKVFSTSQRDFLIFHQIWAVRPRDLLQALNRYTPDIVHFSAHGSPTGELLFLDDHRNAKPVDEGALQALFTTLKDKIRVVILNACYSQKQARTITKVIDCAIGMQTDITDQAAILFSSTFYQALGFGRSVQEAFEQGKVALQLEGIPEHHIPQLIMKKGIDARNIHVISDVQNNNRKGELNKKLKSIEDTMRRGHYQSAYQGTMRLLQGDSYTLTDQEEARLRYCEALIHLSGKRPAAQSPSVVRRAEEALQSAIDLHNLFSYKKILALIKQDFARNGVQERRYKQEAQKLLKQAEHLQVKSEDREILDLFSLCQAQLSHDYRHLLAR